MLSAAAHSASSASETSFGLNWNSYPLGVSIVAFLAFICVVSVVGYGLLLYRLPLLRSRGTLDSWISREAAFTVNNWILLFAAFFIMFATMFPTISEAVTHEHERIQRQ